MSRLSVSQSLRHIVPRVGNCLMLPAFFVWSIPAHAEEPSPNTAFSYVIVAGVAFAIFCALMIVGFSLSGSSWKLSDALSEEADISPRGEDGKPIPGAGKPQVISELTASSSRFIALVGLIGILGIYVGFGLVILQGFASSRILPDDKQVQVIVWFLVAGVTMFAPYIANKFSSIFDWFKPTK